KYRVRVCITSRRLTSTRLAGLHPILECSALESGAVPRYRGVEPFLGERLLFLEISQNFPGGWPDIRQPPERSSRGAEEVEGLATEEIRHPAEVQFVGNTEVAGSRGLDEWELREEVLPPQSC